MFEAIKINRVGNLHLSRKSSLVEQYCKNGEEVVCSHDCALFGEPFERGNHKGEIGLQICEGRVLVCHKSSFLDERS